MSNSIKLPGRVRPYFQSDIDDGVYNNSTVYDVGARVLYENKPYECIKSDGQCHLPTNTEFWECVTIGGSDGKMPSHYWNGTTVYFEQDDGTYDAGTDLKGPNGNDGKQLDISDAIDSDSSTVGGTSKALYTARAKVESMLDKDFFLLGTVIPFYGSFGGTDNRYPIPTGSTEPDTRWVICDGVETNGIKVPDLRGRFIVGSGTIGNDTIAMGETGGSETHSHTVEYSNLSMTAATGGSLHTHSITSVGTFPWSSSTTYYVYPQYDYSTNSKRVSDSSSSSATSITVYQVATKNVDKLTWTNIQTSTSAGGSQVHNHTITNNGAQTTNEVSNITSYYKLCFIMKICNEALVLPKSIAIPYFKSTGTQHTTGIGLNQPSTLNDLVITYDTGEYLAAGDTLLITQTGNGSGTTQLVATGTGGWNIPVNSGWTINDGADKAVITIVSSSVSTFSNGATQIEITIN